MRTHLNVLALLYLLGSLGELFVAMLVLGVLGGAGALSGDLFAFSFLVGLGTFIGFFLLILGLPGLVLAWGFWKQRGWSRPLGFILGILNLFNAPLGTILGLYTLWVLIQDETGRLLQARPV